MLATAIVVTRRFEAASGPVWEAFATGVLVACSDVTSLPEQVGDSALIFNPDHIEAIAGAILALWMDAERGRGRPYEPDEAWLRSIGTGRPERSERTIGASLAMR